MLDLGYNANELQNATCREMECDDNIRVRELMNVRRLLSEKQIASDVTKSKLCDDINKIKNQVVGLPEKILKLENDDNELYTYIRSLELINKGIWCSKCDNQKCIDNEAGRQVDDELHLQTAKILQNALLEIQEWKVNCNEKINYFENLLTNFKENTKAVPQIVGPAIKNDNSIVDAIKVDPENGEIVLRDVIDLPKENLDNPLHDLIKRELSSTKERFCCDDLLF